MILVKNPDIDYPGDISEEISPDDDEEMNDELVEIENKTQSMKQYQNQYIRSFIHIEDDATVEYENEPTYEPNDEDINMFKMRGKRKKKIPKHNIIN